jgi:ribonuclease P protein component
VAVIAPAREGADAKLGLAVSRRVGNAVARNHVKRRVREWFRRARPSLPPATDWVVIARGGAAALDGRAIAAELTALAKR